MAITNKQRNKAIMLELFKSFLLYFQDDSEIDERVNSASREWTDCNWSRETIEKLKGELGEDISPLTAKDALKNKEVKNIVAEIVQDKILEFFHFAIKEVREEQEADRLNDEDDRKAEEENATCRTVIVDGVEYKLVPTEK